MSTNLSQTDLELMRKQFSASPKNRVVQNAVAQTSIDGVALDREVVVGTDTTVSNLLDDWSVTNQKKSGRCWLFAGLNLLRVGAARALNPMSASLTIAGRRARRGGRSPWTTSGTSSAGSRWSTSTSIWPR
jgi:aminopeptidase C